MEPKRPSSPAADVRSVTASSESGLVQQYRACQLRALSTVEAAFKRAPRAQSSAQPSG